MLLPFKFDQLNDGTYFISNEAGFHRFLERDQLENLIDENVEELGPDLFNSLRRGLFLSDEKSPDYAPPALASAQAKRLLRDFQFSPTFMIVPTLRCDHACTYCQVSRASLSAKNYDLDPEKIPKILDLIRVMGAPPYKIEVQGGEPLVRFDLVNLIYDEAERVLGTDSFEMVVTTSLSLISEDILSWAKNRNILFSTSLDGTALIHDENRILVKESSFGKVKRGILAIQESIGIGRVSTVTTVTRGLLENPKDIITAHKQLGLNDLFVRPISPYGFANTFHRTEYSFDEYMAFYDEFFQEIIKENLGGIPLVEHTARIHLKRVFDPNFNGYADLKSPSGVLLDCVMFNYDGRIFGSDEARMLQRAIGDIDFSCSTIDAVNFKNNPLYEVILRDSVNSIQPGCEQCAYQPFCGSDPCQSISEQGEPVGDKSISTFCNFHKSMFQYLLWKYQTDLNARKIMERWIRD